MERVTRWFTALALVLAIVPGQAYATPLYRITDLGDLGGGSSSPQAINDAGQIVGGSTTRFGQGHPFLWSGGVMTDLGTLGGNGGLARDINNSGVIVGHSFNSSAKTRGFIYQNGVMTPMGTLGGDTSYATSINDSGVICGWSALPGNTYDHAFRYSGGVMTNLGDLGGHNSVGLGINGAGTVVGWSRIVYGMAHPTSFTGGVVTDLGTPGTLDCRGQAWAINGHGVAVGWGELVRDGAYHPLLWDEKGITDLGVLTGVNGESKNINDAGQIVGMLDMTGSYEYHGFLYEAGTMYDLNDLVLDNPGWVIKIAYDVNKWGDICAWAANGTQEHALLLTRVVDTTAPRTALQITGTAGSAGWYRSDVTADLTGWDEPGGSGVASVTYRLDDGPATTVPGATATVAVTGDGPHSLAYHSSDRAGNVADDARVTLNIDQTPPTTTCTVDSTAAALAAADATSGLASITYALDGGTAQAYSGPIDIGLAAHTLVYHATDNAGNVEADRTISIPERRAGTALWLPAAGGARGEQVYLQGCLRSGANRLAGETLHFLVGGTEVGTGTTGIEGYASCLYSIPADAPADIPFTVQYAGSAAYQPTSAVGTLTVLSSQPTRIWCPAVSGAVGDTVRLQGVLMVSSTGTRLVGKTLSFWVAGVQVGEGTTQADGYAACSYTIPGGATSDIAFTVQYAGADGNLPCSGAGTIAVQSRQATSIWVVPVTAAGGTSTYLQAVLKVASTGARLNGYTLHFTLGGMPVGDAVTVTDGYAALPFVVPGGSGSLPIGVTFDGDATYQPCTGAGTLTRP